VREFTGSSCALGGWNDGVRHTNDVLKACATVKTHEYSAWQRLMVSHKAFAPTIVGMSGQMLADFLWLLWFLADKQMWLYHESMGKEDIIGNEAFRWARAKAFNSNKTSIGRAIAFGCATCCHLSVHNLALPRPGSGDDSRGGSTGTGAPGVSSRGGTRRTLGDANLSEGGGGLHVCTFSRYFCGPWR